MSDGHKNYVLDKNGVPIEETGSCKEIHSSDDVTRDVYFSKVLSVAFDAFNNMNLVLLYEKQGIYARRTTAGLIAFKLGFLKKTKSKQSRTVRIWRTS